MVRTRLVLASTLIACVAAMLAAVPSTALPSASGASSAVPSTAEECATLGSSIASVWSGRRTEEVSACATLPFAGSVTLRFVQPVGEEEVPITVVDARGEVLCTVSSGLEPACDASSNHTPYRAVVGAGPAQDFHLSVVRLETPRRGCPPLPAGSFGTREGVDLALGGDGAFASCHTVPTRELREGNGIFAFERVAGAGQAQLVVRGQVLGSPGRECRTVTPAAAASTVCQGRDDTGPTTSVLLVTDGQEGTWRLVRRDPSRVGQCTPVASTAVDGPVSTGAPASYVDLECWSVEAAPTDRFVVDVVDDDGTTGVDSFRDGQQWCDATDSSCELGGWDRWVLVARKPAAGVVGGTPYDLQPWRVSGIKGWDAACSRVEGGDFGPLTGTLSTASGGRCVVVDDGAYTVDAGAADSPDVRGIGGPRDSACRQQDGGTWRCEYFDHPLNTGLVLLSRPDGVATLDYEVAGSCVPGRLCDVRPPPTLVQAPAVTGRHVPGGTLSVSTGTWEPPPTGYAYTWLVDGFPVGFGQTLELTGDMVGRDVRATVLTDSGLREGAVWLSQPREVRSAVLEAPTVSGVARVGERLRVDPGRWRPEVEELRIAWFAGDDRLTPDGRSLELRPRHAGRVVRVVVTGRGGEGERLGSETVRVGRVRR